MNPAMAGGKNLIQKKGPISKEELVQSLLNQTS